MGLLDPNLFTNPALLNQLKGLLGNMPIAKLIRGEESVTQEGLLGAMRAMPVFQNDAGQSAYDAAMNIGPMGLGKIVYHGSPHKFDKFDASKIGTGEGAQAYGHGVYLADAEDVAKGYQKTLAYKAFDLGQEAEKRGLKLTAGARGEFHRQAAANRDPMRAAVGLQNANISARELPQEKLAELFDAFQKDGTGALYKADLPDEWIPKMLDWDKPIKDQAPEVQAAFNSWVKPRMSTREIGPDLVDVNIEGGAIGAFTRDVAPDVLANPAKYVPTKGQDLWKSFGGDTFGRGVPDDVQRAKMLQQMGIPGIRYLDGGSRGAGQGSYNYVVFPGLEDKVKILERNGVPLQGLLGGS